MRITWGRGFVLCLWMLTLLIGSVYDNCPALAETQKAVTLDGVTVTATKTEVDPESVPFTAHTVDRENIEAQPDHYMNNIGELIRDVPGVHVGQYYPWGPPWIHLRGTGYFIGRTIYLIDGLPTHSFLSTAIHPNDVEQVDVVLGPSSALYGPNASGGVVNTITREGREGMGAKAEIAYGSNNTVRPHASVGDKVGNWGYYFSYSGDYSDGFKMKPADGMMDLYNLGKKQYIRTASWEDNEYEHTYLAGKVSWKGDSGTRFSLGTNYARRYLYGGQNNYILNDDGDQYVTTARFETPLSSWGKVKFSVGHHYDDHPQQDTAGLKVVDGVPVPDDTITYTTDWTREIIPVDLQTDLYLGEHNVLTVGAFWSNETEKKEQTFWANGNTKYKSELNTEQTALYLQDQMFLMDDRLSLLAGVRYDHWEYYDIFDSGSTNPRPDDISKDHTTFRGGARYRFNDTLSFRTSVGTAFWPGLAKWFFQNITTGTSQREANPGLDPEKTVMGDLGMDLNLRQWGTCINITGYYGEIDDMVSYSYDENPDVPGGSVVRTRNLGGAEIYGLELQLRQQLSQHLWFLGSLTLNHSRIKDDPKNDGNQLRNAPDYFGSLGLRYLNPELVNGEVLFRFSDDRFYDDNNTDLPYFHMESYETVDLKIWRDWKLSPEWVLTTSLSAVNLTDEEYATEIVYVNPGRYVEGAVGVKYLF